MERERPSNQPILNNEWEEINLANKNSGSRLIETFWLDGYVSQDEVFHSGGNTLSYFEALLDTGRARQEKRHTDDGADEYDLVLNDPDEGEPRMDPWDPPE
jgi:hypothetical protein